MGRLYLNGLKRNFRCKEELFWPLVFPLILATLFFVTFGSGISTEKMGSIPAAVVSEGNVFFESFLKGLDGEMLSLSKMDEAQAEEALRNGKVEGIFYCRKEPELVVAGSDISESILEALLDGYLENQTMLTDIGENNMLRLPAAVISMLNYKEMTQAVSVGGKSTDNNLTYFFALVGMACLFGCFSGMDTATQMRADQSALAARRSIAPQNRLTMILAEMLADFTQHFFCISVLLVYLRILGISFGEKWYLLLPVCIFGSITGVTFGMFIGTRRLHEGMKIGIMVLSSLLMSFFAGLMMGNMKDIIEHHCPVLNRINPAALIADAFYSVSIYDNPMRYRMNLLLLAVIAAVLVAASYLTLRRERYESL